MRYADCNCTIACDGNDYIIKGRDRFTGTPVTVRVPTNEMFAYRQGVYIQDAMISVSDAEREFLLSGMYDSFPFEEEDC